MKIKTSELIGSALDHAVAICEETIGKRRLFIDGFYSTNWREGGPIIEREKLAIIGYEKGWEAYRVEESEYDYYLEDSLKNREVGPTPLIAAMRCLVASKLGDEVDIPEELL